MFDVGNWYVVTTGYGETQETITLKVAAVEMPLIKFVGFHEGNEIIINVASPNFHSAELARQHGDIDDDSDFA